MSGSVPKLGSLSPWYRPIEWLSGFDADLGRAVAKPIRVALVDDYATS